MTLHEALKQLAEQDPYATVYAWLYLPKPYSPSAAALYIIRPDDLQEAGIGINADSYDSIADAVEWLLTSTGCSWRDLRSLPPSAVTSPLWELSTGNCITDLIKGANNEA